MRSARRQHASRSAAACTAAATQSAAAAAVTAAAAAAAAARVAAGGGGGPLRCDERPCQLLPYGPPAPALSAPQLILQLLEGPPQPARLVLQPGGIRCGMMGEWVAWGSERLLG